MVFSRATKSVLLLLILLYRKYISFSMLNACRHSPSCSEYAEQALKTHPLVSAIRLIIMRMLRCQPFAIPGHDPVPPAGYELPDLKSLSRA